MGSESLICDDHESERGPWRAQRPRRTPAPRSDAPDRRGPMPSIAAIWSTPEDECSPTHNKGLRRSGSRGAIAFDRLRPNHTVRIAGFRIGRATCRQQSTTSIRTASATPKGQFTTDRSRVYSCADQPELESISTCGTGAGSARRCCDLPPRRADGWPRAIARGSATVAVT